MIVWLNGAFGVGKTTAARRLTPLLPDARVHDPERLGWILQRSIGHLQRGDFQHLASWRRGTVLLTRLAATRHDAVIVTMSVLRPDYLDELIAGLAASGHDVHHVTLDAPPTVLHARIDDGDYSDPRATEWRRRHVEVYDDVKDEIGARGLTIETAERTPDEIAAEIAAGLSVSR